MAQLVESIERPLQVKDGKTLKGVFAICDVFNQNGRRYPEDIYNEAYAELVPKIRERRLLGELDHPIDRDEVFLSNVSHVITDCHPGQSKSGCRAYYGKIELLDTPAGKIAQALVKAGIPLGISSRGVGNTRQVPGGVDVTQLKLITYDLVAEPSFKSAVLSEENKSELAESLNSIESKLPLNESKEYDSIRDRINTIRESFKLTEPGVHIDQQEVQTIELNALKSLLESKSRIIEEDTRKLKEHRKIKLQDAQKISELESDLTKMKSRYTAILENHRKLQDSYNNLQANYQKKLNEQKTSSDNEILELRKRLAVEKRGMSYSRVQNLLEGASTEKEINTRLDTLSSMSIKSPRLTESMGESIQKIPTTSSQKNSLSSVISRV